LGDVDRMARYCVDLLTHPKKQAIFRANARERAEKVYDISLIVPKYEEVYRELVPE
jgi:glycosyltransferase involved in cell wall biosynthesis